MNYGKIENGKLVRFASTIRLATSDGDEDYEIGCAELAEYRAIHHIYPIEDIPCSCERGKCPCVCGCHYDDDDNPTKIVIDYEAKDLDEADARSLAVSLQGQDISTMTDREKTTVIQKLADVVVKTLSVFALMFAFAANADDTYQRTDKGDLRDSDKVVVTIPTWAQGNTAPRQNVIVLSEDNLTSVVTNTAKAKAPWSTSYGSTMFTFSVPEITEMKNGMVFSIVVGSSMVVNSTYRNVAIQINDLGYIPVFGNATTILAGSTYFTTTNHRLYEYRTDIYTGTPVEYEEPTGGFHLYSDSNDNTDTKYDYLKTELPKNNVIIADDGYYAKSSLAFATSPHHDANDLRTYSSLVASSATTTTKNYTHTTGKYYIDQPYLWTSGANYAAGATVSGYTMAEDYGGVDLRYSGNLSADYMTANRELYLWLKDYDPTEQSFKNSCDMRQFVTKDKLAAAFENETDPVYLYYMGRTGAYYYTYARTGESTERRVLKYDVENDTLEPADEITRLGKEVSYWSGYIDGTNVTFVITNYISGAYNKDWAKLKINELREGEYREVYNSRQEILTHLNDFKEHDFVVATNQIITAVDNKIADKADKAWGKYTSAGGVAPSNTVYMTAPNTVFAGGMEYERVAVGEGTIAVLTTRGAPTYTAGDEGTFKFQDGGGTNYFGFAKTDSYTIGCRTDGINVSQHIVTLTYNITMSGVPCVWWSPTIGASAIWYQLNTPDGEPIEGAPKTVTWETNPDPDTEVCYIDCTEAQGFFKATVEVQGSAKFMTNMPADFSAGILCTDGIHKAKINWNNGSPQLVPVSE